MVNKILIKEGELINGIEFVRNISREDDKLYAEFKCKCGKLFITAFASVRRGDTKSCGCSMVKHGMAKKVLTNAEYNVWNKMKSRCLSETCPAYPDYGGRGITVCDRWLSFSNFFEDMGFRPTKKHQLERVDNDKGYSPENCTWATKNIQSRNTRSNVYIEYGEHRYCLKDWSRLLKLEYATFHKQIRGKGWSIEKCIERYEKKHKIKFTVDKNLLPDDIL